MSDFISALTCAAFLLNYSGDFPEVIQRDREPTQEECTRDLKAYYSEYEWLKAQVRTEEEPNKEPKCYALTYWYKDKLDSFVVVMSSSAPFRIQLTEALRIINVKADHHLNTPEIYALRERAWECQAAGMKRAAPPKQEESDYE